MDRAKGYCLHSPYEIEKCVTMKHVIGNIIQKVTSFIAWKENMRERNYFIS